MQRLRDLRRIRNDVHWPGNTRKIIVLAESATVLSPCMRLAFAAGAEKSHRFKSGGFVMRFRSPACLSSSASVVDSGPRYVL